MKVPISTPKESFYLELGILPIGVIVKARRINYLRYLITRNENEMLYKFFIMQWYQPCRGDWTETVKKNLEEFDIPCDFTYIKSKSGEAFKRIVKVKAQEYALKILTAKQQGHSKMDELSYSELKPQKYLTMENASIEHVRNIFRHRVRMSKFGENYRGNSDHVMCPLCGKHFDSQNLSFQCKFYRGKLDIKCNMTDIYSDNVTLDTAKTITKMMKLREEELRN